MALSTYNELKTSVADWLNRQDLTPVIPDFIRLLEAQVERTLRVREMFLEATITLDANGELTLPEGFLQLREMRLLDAGGVPIPISYAAPNEMTQILADAQGVAGIPRAYTMHRSTAEFAPLPQSTYTVKLFYVGKIPKLSSTVSTNWLLEQHPDVYLYGALMQAAPYLKNDERITVWGSALSTLLEDIRVADERALKAGTPLKMRFKPYG
jgi:hypothetical protein